MSSCKLHIESPGLYSSLQDLGRPGYQEFGIPVGGAADRKSYLLANELVNNPKGAPCIEITMIGPIIRFEIDNNISLAITGANISPKLNGQALEMNKSVSICNNDILEFGECVAGCRSYIAIGGEWEVTKWKDSVSPRSICTRTTPKQYF